MMYNKEANRSTETTKNLVRKVNRTLEPEPVLPNLLIHSLPLCPAPCTLSTGRPNPVNLEVNQQKSRKRE